MPRSRIISTCRTLGLLLSGLATTANAAGTCQADADQAGLGVGLYVDQDMFVPGTNRDRDYTMGVAIEVFQDQGPLYLMTDLLDRVDPLVGFDTSCGRLYRSFTLGSLVYTPDDIGDPAPIFDDRPYASLIYLANKKVVADDDTALGVELTVGALGLNVARVVQTNLHRWYRDATGDSEPVDPQGWNHQVSHGGEPTGRVRLSYAARLDGGRYWDIAHSYDANLGFQVNASLGLTARAGLLKSGFWSVPYAPVNRGNFVPDTRGGEIYTWVAGRLRAVAYDALLQGQFRNSTVTVAANEMRRLVWEAGAGITASWQGTQFTMSVNAKAGETLLANAPHKHVWGGIYLSREYE